MGSFLKPGFRNFRGREGSGKGPWVPNGSPLTHMVNLLSFLSSLAGSKSVLVRADLNYYMSHNILVFILPVLSGYDEKYRALESIDKSSGKNKYIDVKLGRMSISHCIVVPIRQRQLHIL